MRKILLLNTLLIAKVLSAIAGEGMWLPLLVEKYNIADMQQKGLQLSAGDIYSVNQACLKDAVVLFGRGCTGEIVSGEGLLLTNHHCGFGAIQSHSSVEKDYLRHGFWAMNKSEELPTPDLSVKFLVRMEDVTDQVLEGIQVGMSNVTRNELIRRNSEVIREKNTRNTHYTASVESFYYGNEFYLFVYEEFKDVRLVGAPPSSIGNFGEDNDNWIWPRHTGDFSIFRVYAGEDNKPAAYAPSNKPYQPKKILEISLNGIEADSFTMVMGYPARTYSYYTSDALESIMETYPKKISLRSLRLDIMGKYMKADDAVRIQYASKYRNVSNAWKKWEGVLYGFNANDAVNMRRLEEAKFMEWAETTPELAARYLGVLPRLRELYAGLDRYALVFDYSSEAVLAPEMIDFAMDIYKLAKDEKLRADRNKRRQMLQNLSEQFYKDYYEPVDREVFKAMLEAYAADISPEFHPAVLTGNSAQDPDFYEKYTNRIYAKSIFKSRTTLDKWIGLLMTNEAAARIRLENDPAILHYNEFVSIYTYKVLPDFTKISGQIDELYRTYMQGLREMNGGGILHPDANFTMRVAYGKAAGYSPSDGVFYDYYSTLDGIMEKFATGASDYSVPEKLLELYTAGYYGPYADKDGKLRVNFIATNHTSGGNSGSPVMNGKGQLLGLNFDRNWEGTMGDFMFDETFCRNITVDIRYILFIIDYYAGAGYLLNEMIIK
jgi:hypothetical protein